MALSTSGNAEYQPSFPLLVGLVLLVVVAQLLWLDWTQTAKVLGDADDAMRLVEVREFLDGRGWFDLHESRLQPPIGYDTHWSRLIDAGLAGLFLIFRTFGDAALAERLMRIFWPLLWLLPAFAGTIALTWRLGGRAASLVTLILLLLGLPAFYQFKPGRIDHHDVQITLALLTLAAAIWADRVQWAAWVAGALSGAALGIGIEGMPFIVLAGATFVVRYVMNRNHAAALAQYGLSSAATVTLVFFISVGPNHWMKTACDAIAVNLAAPAALGGIALGVVALLFNHERRFVRCIAVVIALGLAAFAFVYIEPRCLSGPLAMVDPTVRSLWLAHVPEAQSLMNIIRDENNLLLPVAIAAYPIAAVTAAIVLVLDHKFRIDSGFISAVAALLLAIAMTIVAVRILPYAIWLGMPFVAAALLRLYDWLKLTTLPARALVAIVFTPSVLCFGSAIFIDAVGLSQPMNGNQRRDTCFKIDNYAALARLPVGTIVTDVYFGPFLLALTPHSVLGAPYHRLSYGIVASYLAFAKPPDEARTLLRDTRATYLITCGLRSLNELTELERQQRSMEIALIVGHIPDWLERMPDTAPFSVYRIKP